MSMPNVDQMIRFENGEMDEDETVAFFQNLIDGGYAWTLQGFYGRMASDLIAAGLCHATPRDGRTLPAQARERVMRQNPEALGARGVR